MVKRTEPPKRNDKVTVNIIYYVYKAWYNREYGNQYFKCRKDFFESIAGAAGIPYTEMKRKEAHGIILMDYTLNAEYFRENDDLLPLGFIPSDIAR